MSVTTRTLPTENCRQSLSDSDQASQFSDSELDGAGFDESALDEPVQTLEIDSDQALDQNGLPVLKSQLVRPQLAAKQDSISVRTSLLPRNWFRSSKTMLLLISALCIGLFVSSLILAV